MTQRWGAQPAGFNHAAANAVYKALASLDDDSAQVLGRMFVEASVQHVLLEQGHELAKAADAVAKRQAAVLRKGLAREAVAKSRRGEDPRSELAALEMIVKASGDDPYNRDKEGRFSMRELRNGAYVREQVPIGFDSSIPLLKDKHRNQFGIPASPGFKGQDAQRFQQASIQLNNLLGRYANVREHAVAHLHINDDRPGGLAETKMIDLPKVGQKVNLNTHLAPGQHLAAVSVSVVPPVSAAGAAFDAFDAVGMPRAGNYAYSTINEGFLSPDRMSDLADELEGTNYKQQDYIPSRRAFAHLSQGSKLLRDSLGPSIPRSARTALVVGEHVGRLGPQAQRVIGPTADKAAYRYRGTEAPLSERLRNALAQHGNRKDSDPRWTLLHGNAKRDKSAPAEQWRPSGVLEYFRDQLPSADLNTLHLKSGAVPPSRGIILDKAGNVSDEAVGYGDDHYLPFNLKRLSKLKGGEYIRTRSFGGPTTEDIYTGLMSGAKGLTVVSHNGVYTIDFDPALKGGRRFNDKAARMVGRYGHLLDAVKYGQVQTGGIAGSRLAELADQANQLYPKDTYGPQYTKELERLKAAEVEHPTLSAQQRNKAIVDFFSNDVISPGRGVGDARQAMVESYVDREARRAQAEQAASYAGWNERAPAGEQMVPDSLDAHRAAVRQSLVDTPLNEIGDRYADILGLRPQLDAAINRAAQENAERLTPLSLNGRGYIKALEALQEEFPHYIDDVRFHPWKPGHGPRDTGYVRPKHNRAAQALAGYFDTQVSREGKGKVYADTTRYQNRRLAPREATHQASEGKAEQAATGKTPAASADELRATAARNFYDAVQKQTTFGIKPTAFPGLKGEAISTWKRAPELAKAAPNLTYLLNLSPDQFAEELREKPAKVWTAVQEARNENREGYLDLPSDVTRSVDSDGKPQSARKLSEHPAKDLDRIGENFDFPGAPPAFDPAEKMSADRIAIAYKADPAISKLVRSGDLPDHPGSADFPAALTGLVADLKGKRDALDKLSRSGVVLTDHHWGPVDVPAEGAIRAAQLHRNFMAVPTPTTTAAPVSQMTTQFILPEDFASMDPDQIKAVARQLQAAGSALPPGMTINPDGTVST